MWAGMMDEPDRLSSSRKEQAAKVFREGVGRIVPLKGVLEEWDAGGGVLR